MKRMMLLMLGLALLVNTSGCCSIIHGGNYSSAGSRGQFRPLCYIFGNFLFGGLIGWVVDLADGAAWEPAESATVASTNTYLPICEYEEGDENPGSPIREEYLMVELTDGTSVILANVHRQEGSELPEGSIRVEDSRIAKKTWVVPASPDYSPKPPKACELAEAVAAM